jgi:hypothetical protein
VDSTGAGTYSVTAGAGVIYDSAFASQAPWEFEIDNGVAAVAFPARPGVGTSRIDLIVARIYDVDISVGSVREVKIERVNGAASATPSAPALPALSLLLATCTVPNAGAITVVSTTAVTTAAGGILPVATTAEMDALKTSGTAYRGMVVDNAQTGSLHRYDGTNWKRLRDDVDRDAVGNAYWGTAYNATIHRIKTYSSTVVVTPDANGDVTLVPDLTTLGFVGIGGPVACLADRNQSARTAVVAIGGNALGARLYLAGGSAATGLQRVNFVVHGWVAI